MAARGNQANGAASGQAARALPALGADELLVMRDPAKATAGSLPYLQYRLRTVLSDWGLPPPDAESIHLATEDGANVIALTWNADWGTKPTTRDLSANVVLDPVDARASITGVHSLAGWTKVAGDDRQRLDTLLGGESNGLSIAARSNLRHKFKSLRSASDDEQAAALKGVLTDPAAQPFVGDEHVSNARVNFRMSGPTDVKDYAFRGVVADAEQWHATYDDGVDVLVTAPKAPTDGMHYYSAQEAADAAAYLPKAARSLIKNVVLNAQVNPEDAHWAAQYHRPDFHSYMTAGADGVVMIYPSAEMLGGTNEIRGALQHETGHTWSKRHWGEDTTKGKWVQWKTAMDADKVSVSAYAQASLDEDFAETVKTYLSTQDTPRHAEYQAIVPNRFAILDSEYK